MNKQPQSINRNQRGFTLIELLISITLMAVILGVLAAGISVIAKGWDKNTAHITTQDMFSRGFDLLRRDIEGLQRLVWKKNDLPQFIFKGDVDTLKFVVIEPPYPTRPGPYFVSFFIKKSANDNMLMRARQAFHPDIRDFAALELQDEVPLLEGPFRYRFSYADTRTGIRKWFRTWPHKNKLPDLIKLEVTDLSSGEAVFAPFVAKLRIDAEPGCVERKPIDCTVKSRGALATNAKKIPVTR